MSSGVVLIALLGLFGSSVAEIWRGIGTETVFADEFSSAEIDSRRWRTKGKSVRTAEGAIKVSVEETDNPGILRSEFFTVDPSKPITIASRIKVTYSQNIKDKVYFGGGFVLITKTFNLGRSIF